MLASSKEKNVLGSEGGRERVDRFSSRRTSVVGENGNPLDGAFFLDRTYPPDM